MIHEKDLELFRADFISRNVLTPRWFPTPEVVSLEENASESASESVRHILNHHELADILFRAVDDAKSSIFGRANLWS